MGLRHPVLVMRAYIHVISNTHTQMQSRSRPHAHMHVHPPTFTHMSRYGEEQVKCELAPTRSIMEMRAGSSCVPRLHSCFAWRSSSFVLYYTTILCMTFLVICIVLYYNTSLALLFCMTFLFICIVLWKQECKRGTHEYLVPRHLYCMTFLVICIVLYSFKTYVCR